MGNKLVKCWNLINGKKPEQVTSDPSCKPEGLDVLYAAFQINLCKMCISTVDSEMPSIQNKGKEKLGKCFHFTLSFRITVISSSIFICRIAKLARWLENVKIQLYFCPSELGIVKYERHLHSFPPASQRDTSWWVFLPDFFSPKAF